jgi:hypothetical protein
MPFDCLATPSLPAIFKKQKSKGDLVRCQAASYDIRRFFFTPSLMIHDADAIE